MMNILMKKIRIININDIEKVETPLVWIASNSEVLFNDEITYIVLNNIATPNIWKYIYGDQNIK